MLNPISLVDSLVGGGGSNVSFECQIKVNRINGTASNQTSFPQSGEVDLGDYWFKWGKTSSLIPLSSDRPAANKTEGMFLSGRETQVNFQSSRDGGFSGR